MDIFETIDTRKTIRKFDSYLPTDEEIKRIINSARVAPSAMNTQNWRFIAVKNQETKHKMANAVLETYDEILSNLDEELKSKVERYKGHSVFFEKAPVVIVCVEETAPSFMGGVLEAVNYDKETINLMRPDSYLLSMGGAIENILLSAQALGLGSCWMVAPVLACKKIKQILNLNENQKIVSLLSIGKPAEDSTDKRSPKKSLEEIMQII